MLKSSVFYVGCIIDGIVNKFRFNGRINIINSKDTIDLLVENNLSICRYGDGEFNLIKGKGNGFQPYNKELSVKLESILNSEQKNCTIGVPSVLNGKGNIKLKPWLLWQHLIRSFFDILPRTNEQYLDSLVTRPYMDYIEKQDSHYIFDKFKELFHEKKLLIVEGYNSRLGIGNDLFDGANSIRRILCPNINSFERYDEIIASVRKHRIDDEIVIIALGPTATVLAWELSKEDIRSLDLGHIDIEYEWYLSNAKGKQKISGKNVNEVSFNITNNRSVDLETLYKPSIIVDEII